MEITLTDVRFALPDCGDTRREGPKADILRCGRASLFDHLVGDREQRGRHDETKHPCGLRVNDKLEFCRLYHRQVGRSFTLGNPPGIDTGLAPSITVARQTRPYPRAGPRNQMAQTRPVTITIKAPNQRLGMRPTFAMPMR